jgi:hypothetical protein
MLQALGIDPTTGCVPSLAYRDRGLDCWFGNVVEVYSGFRDGCSYPDPSFLATTRLAGYITV